MVSGLNGLKQLIVLTLAVHAHRLPKPEHACQKVKAALAQEIQPNMIFVEPLHANSLELRAVQALKLEHTMVQLLADLFQHRNLQHPHHLQIVALMVVSGVHGANGQHVKEVVKLAEQLPELVHAYLMLMVVHVMVMTLNRMLAKSLVHGVIGLFKVNAMILAEHVVSWFIIEHAQLVVAHALVQQQRLNLVDFHHAFILKHRAVEVSKLDPIKEQFNVDHW